MLLKMAFRIEFDRFVLGVADEVAGPFLRSSNWIFEILKSIKSISQVLKLEWFAANGASDRKQKPRHVPPGHV